MLNDELYASFRVLELPPNASLQEVRDAYRLLSRVWHPDRFAGNAELLAKATAKQQELNVAYQTVLAAHARGFAPSAPAGPHASPEPSSQQRAQRAGDDRTSRSAAADAPDVWEIRRVRPLTLAAASALAAVLLLVAAPFLRRDHEIRTRDGARLLSSHLAIGGDHGCAAAAAEVYCWGDNPDAQQSGEVAALTARAHRLALPDTARAIAAGASHTCALLTAGRVHCWGGNYSGQLGNHSLDDRATPVALRTDARFTSISSLAYHSCGITNAGMLYCWGNDTDGQLGAGKPVAECRWNELRFYCSDRPERVAGERRWRDVAAGGSHTCAVDRAGSAFCWGSNRAQQLGATSRESCLGPGGVQPCSRTPLKPSGLPANVVAITAGAAHSCALTGDGRVYCWGASAAGQSGTADSVATPAPLNTSLRFTAIAAGGYHSCALTAAGALYCWGSDANGELRGEARRRCGSVPCTTRPVRIARAGVRAVALGFGRTCMQRKRGDVVCWGRGDRFADPSPRPRRTVTQATDVLGRSLAAVRWRAAVVKRFVHRSLVAPLEN